MVPYFLQEIKALKRIYTVLQQDALKKWVDKWMDGL